MRLKMASIHVNSPVEAFRFYTETLGFQELLYMAEHNLAIVCAPGQDVGLLLEPSDNPIAANYKEGVYAAGLPAIVMGVPDVKAEYGRLIGAGVTFSQAPEEDSTGITAVFDDTCGNYIQLHQD